MGGIFKIEIYNNKIFRDNQKKVGSPLGYHFIREVSF